MDLFTADYLSNLAAELSALLIPRLGSRLRAQLQGTAENQALQRCVYAGLVAIVASSTAEESEEEALLADIFRDFFLDPNTSHAIANILRGKALDLAWLEELFEEAGYDSKTLPGLDFEQAMQAFEGAFLLAAADESSLQDIILIHQLLTQTNLQKELLDEMKTLVEVVALRSSEPLAVRAGRVIVLDGEQVIYEWSLQTDSYNNRVVSTSINAPITTGDNNSIKHIINYYIDRIYPPLVAPERPLRPVQEKVPGAPEMPPEKWEQLERVYREELEKFEQSKLRYKQRKRRTDEEKKLRLEAFLPEVRRYLSWVADSCGTIELRGIKREGQQVIQLDLETVYVPLEAKQAYPPREVRLNEIFKLGEERIVVTGGPGSGKTTVLLYIAWLLANAILDDKPSLAKSELGLDEVMPLPIFVPISSYATYLRHTSPKDSPRSRTLSSFLTRYQIERQTSFNLPEDFFHELLATGHTVILLLDGLDEVANEDERARVRQSIEDLVTGRRGIKVVVTCRAAAYGGRTALGKSFRELRMMPLVEKDIFSLIRQAYVSIDRYDPGFRKRKVTELEDAIRRLELERKQRIGQGADPLISTPLLVRLLIIVHFSDRHLPEQRAELYLKATEAMLLPEYSPDEEVADQIGRLVGGSREVHLDLVQHLAFFMHSRGSEQGREIDETQLRQVLFKESLQEGLIDDFVALTRLRGTLLEERFGTYRFIHLAFQEFLTARYLAEVIRSVEEIVLFFQAAPILDSWWREPILLVAGYLSLTSPSTAQIFLRHLANAGEYTPHGKKSLTAHKQMAAAELAAVAFLEWQSTRMDLRKELTNRLRDLFEDVALMNQAGATIRVAIGNAMARLGDPRESVMELDKIVFYNVPAGPFYLGCDDTELADDREKPLHEVDIEYDFWVARFPITNAQFKIFRNNGGYQNPRYWREAAKVGVWQEGKVRDYFKEGFRTSQASYGIPFELSNHPVVGISWYEAVAFSRWLTERWRQRGWLQSEWLVRLPTEAEWEKAARGGSIVPEVQSGLDVANLTQFVGSSSNFVMNSAPQRIFPWVEGENLGGLDPDRVNYEDTGISATNSVGAFPGGASPYGAMELSGNVYEWTLNLMREYPYVQDDGREDPNATGDRAFRGGCWASSEAWVRCTARSNGDPLSYHYYRGFRIIIAPSHGKSLA